MVLAAKRKYKKSANHDEPNSKVIQGMLVYT